MKKSNKKERKKFNDLLKSNHLILIVFVLFFVLVLFQHQFMWLYHDDYGYASLSYVYTVDGVIGHTFNLSQLFTFLIGHYKVWGGRVLYFFIECFCLSKGLWLFRLIQSVVITLIFYYTYKIISKFFDKKYNLLISILTICLYGIIDIMVVRSGLLWPTASVLYVFPILPLLMFIYYYDPEKNEILRTILLAILIFAASFSQEQIAVAAVSYMFLIFMTNLFKDKKLNMRDLFLLIAAIAGFAILMLSPGSKIRMSHPSNQGFYELSLFAKLNKSIPDTIYNLFSSYAKIFWSLSFIIFTYIAYFNFRNKKNQSLKYKKVLNFLNTLSLLSILVISVFTLFTNRVYFEYFEYMFQNVIINKMLLVIYIFQLLLIVYSITVYFIAKKNFIMLYLSYAAVLSQAAMFMSSYYPLRSLLVFQLLFYPIILYVVFDFLKQFKINSDNKILKLACLSFAFIAFVNYYSITRGYYRNNFANKENDQILVETSQKIKNGEKIEKIVLHKLPDIVYAGEQPYTEGYDYILLWLRKYYDLPEDVEISYE